MFRTSLERPIVKYGGKVKDLVEYEEQPFGNSGKGAVGLECVGALSCDLLALDIMPRDIIVMGFSEKWQDFVKNGYADTCEYQKHGWIIPCFPIVHPFVNVLVSCVCAI